MASDRTVMRTALDALWPKGSAWKVAVGGQYDQYLDGFTDDLEISRENINDAGNIGSPKKTSELSDLEMDFGVLPDDAISTAARRTYLQTIKGSRGFIPSWEKLEIVLRAAGFDVRVYTNDPPIDVDPLPAGAELLVNGDSVTTQEKDYTATVSSGTSGETTVCADTESTPVADRGATVGAFQGMLRYNYEYQLPNKWYRYPFLFWVCGSRTSSAFADWNMQYATITKWTTSIGAEISKTYENKTRGIRALKIEKGTTPTPPLGAYAQALELETIVTTSVTVTVEVSDVTATRKAGLMVADKDGTWDTGGIVWLATGATGTLTYTATNGVSNARLYLGGSITSGDYAIFDNLKIDGPVFVDAEVALTEKTRFQKMILRYKPLRAWAILLVDYTEPAGGVVEDDEMYRFQVTSIGGTLTVDDAETAVHIIFTGTGTGYTIKFADATTFTQQRLYRFTNQSTQPIDVENQDGSIADVLLPGNVMQVTLADLSTAAGDFNMKQHVTGEGNI